MLSAQKRRRAVVIEGDYHASAVGKMMSSSQLKRKNNPIEVVLVGTLGSGDIAFPSSFRKLQNSPSLIVDMDQQLEISEKNGFTIIDVTPEKIVFRVFTWRSPQSVDQIDAMDPVITYEVEGLGVPTASAA